MVKQRGQIPKIISSKCTAGLKKDECIVKHIIFPVEDTAGIIGMFIRHDSVYMTGHIWDLREAWFAILSWFEKAWHAIRSPQRRMPYVLKITNSACHA